MQGHDPSRERELNDVLGYADKLRIAGPRPAGPPIPLDLAEIIDQALARGPDDDDASSLALRAGLLLSELTRDQRDGMRRNRPRRNASS